MGFIGKFFITIFTMFSGLFLFVMLFRLNNDRGAYIGLSDIYYYFQNNSVDIWDSFTDMISYVSDTLEDFKNSFIDFTPFTEIWEDGFEWYETFTIIWEGFKYLFNITLNLSKLIFMPLGCIYYFLQYVIGTIVWFFQFLQYVLTA